MKSILPHIDKDVALTRIMIEDEATVITQQLDIVYSQSIVLYGILPNAPNA